MLLISDIGGTHGRLQLWDPSSPDPSLVFSATLAPSSFPCLELMLRAFLAAAALPSPARIRLAVLAVCGPTWSEGRFNESNNIPRWCPPGRSVSFHDATALEAALGWAPSTLRFINDFEAVGFGVVSLLGGGGGASAPAAPRCLRAATGGAPPPPRAAPAACVGAGTGLGACVIAPPRGGGFADAAVIPSEAGMADTISPRTELEWRLLRHLRSGGAGFAEVERVVSGPGVVEIFFFLQADGAPGAGDASAAAVAEEVRAAPEEARGAVIARHARLAAEGHGGGGGALCLAAVDLFLTFYGRFLTTAAMTHLCYNGLFIAGGILPKLAWREGVLLAAFADAGPKMGDTVGRVPLFLLEDADCGLKGALFFALRLLQDCD